MAESKTSGGLAARIVSALVLAPAALAAVWFGGLALAALVLLAGILMAGEWQAMAVRSIAPWAVPVQAALLGVVLLLAGLQHFSAALLALAAAAVAAAGIALASGGRPGWAAGGAVYIGLPCIALLWLSAHPSGGRGLLFFLLAAVWATDTGAYAFGRLIGGPKLAPRFSPKKTWAGFFGGLACAGAVGAAASAWLGLLSATGLVLLALGLALVAQIGDLVESAFKRRFGVKDAGRLIPGHGGVLDRLDSLLLATPLLAALVFLLLGAQSWP